MAVETIIVVVVDLMRRVNRSADGSKLRGAMQACSRTAVRDVPTLES